MKKPTVRVKVTFRTCRRNPEAAPPRRPTGPTAIARRIALAHLIEEQVEAAELRSYADAADRFGLTRARITQVCDLTLLAPDIQASVLLGHIEPRDRHLRLVGNHRLWTDQRRVFAELFPEIPLEEAS